MPVHIKPPPRYPILGYASARKSSRLSAEIARDNCAWFSIYANANSIRKTHRMPLCFIQ